jgi:hypothetical protein
VSAFNYCYGQIYNGQITKEKTKNKQTRKNTQNGPLITIQIQQYEPNSKPVNSGVGKSK